jgi:hypothetical protein
VSELRREVELLIRRVGHWGPPRWAAPAASGTGSRAEVVHGLVQRLADRCADAERLPRHAVPRLDNDLALVDQLRVLTADLEAVADGDMLVAASADTAETRTAL